MSFNTVNTDANKFGYRLLTPNGEIISLKNSEISEYRADESDALVIKVLNAQTKTIADHRLDVPVVLAAKGGSIIIASDSVTAEKASAWTFPVSEYDRAARQMNRTAQKTEGLRAGLVNDFGSAAYGYFKPLPLTSDFKAAVRPANINGPVFSQDFDEMRLAA